MLLYVHVPFCRAKCAYCAFYSVPFDMDALELYLDAFEREAAYFGKTLGNPELETIFLGGGTPSMLPVWALERMIRAIRDNFTIARDVEFSMEANPDSIDAFALEDIRKLGVNRLSIGIQSLDDHDLKVLGRPHTRDQALAALNSARMAGFANINIDLIWGLPGQRLLTWLNQLKEVAKEIKPAHISAYSLTLEEGTRFTALVDDGKLELPDEDVQSRMFIHGSRFLEEHGYLHYEISNFAKMGFVCRHNLGYWEGRDYLGLGPSAVSTIKGFRRENARDINKWAEHIRAGNFSAGTEKLTDEDVVREMIMLSLRTSRGLDLKAYRDKTGKNFVDQHKAMLTALRKHELVRITKDYVRLSKNGMLVSNVILEKLLYPDE